MNKNENQDNNNPINETSPVDSHNETFEAQSLEDNDIDETNTVDTTNDMDNHSSTKHQPSHSPKSKLGGLAFLIALIALGISGYNGYNYYLQTQPNTQNNNEPKIDEINQQIANIKKELESSPKEKILSNAQIEQLINEKIASQVPDTKAIKAIIEKNLNQSNPVNLAEIEQLIAEKLKNTNQSSNQNNNAQILALTNSVKELQSKLNNDNTANPAPIIFSLTSANIASQSGDYDTALRYINQALTAYDLYQLNTSSYAQFKASITKVKTTLETLANQQSPVEQLANLINDSHHWPLKKTDFSQQNTKTDTPETDDNQLTFTDKLQDIGQSILDKSFRVTKISEANIVWINADKRLEAIIRENLRLDLTAAQNAALLNNSDALNTIITESKKEIARYFDTDASSIKEAIATLNRIQNSKNNAPDIDSIIKGINQIGGK